RPAAGWWGGGGPWGSWGRRSGRSRRGRQSDLYSNCPAKDVSTAFIRRRVLERPGAFSWIAALDDPAWIACHPIDLFLLAAGFATLRCLLATRSSGIRQQNWRPSRG